MTDVETSASADIADNDVCNHAGVSIDLKDIDYSSVICVFLHSSNDSMSYVL